LKLSDGCLWAEKVASNFGEFGPLTRKKELHKDKGSLHPASIQK